MGGRGSKGHARTVLASGPPPVPIEPVDPQPHPEEPTGPVDRAQRDDTSGGVTTAGPAPDDTEAVVARIETAYHELAARLGQWVPLADLREALPDMDRADLDAALKRIAVTPDHHVIPWDNRLALTDRDHDAALWFGGEYSHAIALPPRPDGTPPAPAPADDAARSDPAPADRPARTEQAPPAPGARVSAEPLWANNWGGDPTGSPVYFHPDGQIGQTIENLGADAHLDVDGHALGNLLGGIATDAVMERTTSQQAVDRVRELRDRLPDGHPARGRLTGLAERLDAPHTPPPTVPDSLPAPLRDLVAELHRVPLVRRDPSREMAALTKLCDEFAAGHTGGLRLVGEVRRLRNQRHESQEGKFEIDRAVTRAADALDTMRRNDPHSLNPPATSTATTAAQAIPAPARTQATTRPPAADRIAAIPQRLNEARNRQQARQALAGLSAAELRQLGDHLWPGQRTLPSRATKADMVHMIVEIQVGGRIDGDAIRGHASWRRPDHPDSQGAPA